MSTVYYRKRVLLDFLLGLVLVNLVPTSTGSSATLHVVQLIVYQIKKKLVFSELFLESFVTVRDVVRGR
jgi:hypothetical protein